ncbi:hypothetical protein CWS35_27465 [Bradyrhizobium sp. SK17]|jgi:two-component system KDP operon response regulator KdpE|nr:hypothetical protein CWS35_27465 [Bradyrhizobium sp. SK17]OJY62791.1 MAG: hypothetical protein BGP09_17095 [Rhizobium sp. 60-20]
MHMQSQPMSHIRSGDVSLELRPARSPTNRTIASASAVDPIVALQSGALEDERVVRQWPQVALDGYGAIAVIASDAASRRYITRILQRAGCMATGFTEPQAVLDPLAEREYDVAVVSGDPAELPWCASLLGVRPDLAMLFAFQSGNSDTIAKAIDSGIDCLEAPFLESDLIARSGLLFRSVWRQRGLIIPGGEAAVRLHLYRPRVQVRGREIALTPVEYRTLWALAQSRGGVSRFCDLEKSVWGTSSNARRVALRQVIQGLRRKLNERSDDQRLLKTERCVGYRLLST